METFERKAYEKLAFWKDSSRGSTALLIEGARRVGKSTIAEEFGRRNYASYMLVDFSKAPMMCWATSSTCATTSTRSSCTCHPSTEWNCTGRPCGYSVNTCWSEACPRLCRSTSKPMISAKSTTSNGTSSDCTGKTSPNMAAATGYASRASSTTWWASFPRKRRSSTSHRWERKRRPAITRTPSSGFPTRPSPTTASIPLIRAWA